MPPRRLSVWVALLVLSCCTAAAGAAEIQYVVQISVDGLRGDLLARLLAPGSRVALPNFRRFVVEGATTFDARADYTHTITLPNHACMLTGRPVSRPAGQPDTVQHGYTSNSEPPAGSTLHTAGNPRLRYVASVFDVAHDAGLSTALYASKSKFVLFDRSYDAAHGARDTVPPDFGTDKIDRYVCAQAGSPPTAAPMQAALIADLRARPCRYAFVHYLDPDAAGHALGWGGAAWCAAVQRVDTDLGQLFAVIESEPRLLGHTVVLLTADHGGAGREHSDPQIAADYTIPFLVWGAGIARGADLYALNPVTRANPATGRPDYDANPPPIRNGDSGNLALMLLGLGPIPGSTIDARQDLEVRPAAGAAPAGPSPSERSH